MTLVADLAVAVARLEQRSTSAVPLVVGARVSAVQRFHAVAYIPESRLQYEVVVRVHQAGGVDEPPPPKSDSSEPQGERLAVDVVAEDRPIVDTVRGQVIDPLGVEGAGLARHSSIVPGAS